MRHWLTAIYVQTENKCRIHFEWLRIFFLFYLCGVLSSLSFCPFSFTMCQQLESWVCLHSSWNDNFVVFTVDSSFLSGNSHTLTCTFHSKVHSVHTLKSKKNIKDKCFILSPLSLKVKGHYHRRRRLMTILSTGPGYQLRAWLSQRRHTNLGNRNILVKQQTTKSKCGKKCSLKDYSKLPLTPMLTCPTI